MLPIVRQRLDPLEQVAVKLGEVHEAVLIEIGLAGEALGERLGKVSMAELGVLERSDQGLTRISSVLILVAQPSSSTGTRPSSFSMRAD
jgi:hypothetical protein